MPLVMLLLGLGIAYIALSATVRRLKARWNALGNAGKMAQASLLALLSTLQSFLQVALLALGAFFLLILLAWLASPYLAAGLLNQMQAAAAAASSAAAVTGGFLAQALLWLALGALMWWVWRRRSERLAGPLRAEHARQKAELAAKRSAGELPALAPSEAMMAAFKEMAVFGDLSTGRLQVPDGMTPEQAVAEYNRQAERLLDLDLERRVDLTGIAVDPIDPGESKQWWPALRLHLFSRGVVRTLGWGGKAAGRIGTATACLLIVGVSATTIAGTGLQPYLAHVQDLQVLRSREQAETSLAALFAPPPAPRTEDEPPPQAYAAAARIFLRSVATAPEWRDPPAARPPATLEVELAVEPRRERLTAADFALREAILREAATPASATGEPRLRVASLDPAALPPNAYSGYERLIRRMGTTQDGAEGKVARLLRAAADRQPRIRKAIADYGRSFRQPATLWDYGSAGFSDLFGKAVEAALPEVPGSANPFVGKPWKAGQKGLETAAEQFLRERLARYLDGLMSGSMESARAALEPGSGAMRHFTREEGVAVRQFVDGLARGRAATEAALPPAPSIERVATADERAFVGKMRALLGARPPGQSATLLVGYDDMFPGTASQRAVTAFQQGFGSASARNDLAVLTARDWRRLDADRQVGGVLIGLVPEGRADYRDLAWRRRGSGFDLALIDSRGRRLELGHFDPASLQQAIAYAADGRLTAVTITSAWGIHRVQLHPAFEDTLLGCDLIRLDELVFDETGKNPGWTTWSGRVRSQDRLYNEAVEALRSGKAPKDFPSPSTFSGWRATDPRTSVLAHYREEFDSTVVAAIDDCRDETLPNDAHPFWRCVAGRAGRSEAPERRVGLRSGVREIPYALSDNGGFRAAGAGPTWPLQFKYLAVIDKGPSEAEPASPWPFPPLGGLAQESVESLAARDPGTASLLDRVRGFTILQRVARLALGGQLGPAFPKARLLHLLLEAKAAGPIPAARTPLWGAGAQLAKAEADYNRNRLYLLAELQKLETRIAGDPSKKAALAPCIKALRSLSVPLSQDSTLRERCPGPLRAEGLSFDVGLEIGAALRAIPTIGEVHGDRLRDTAQCRRGGSTLS